MRNRNYQTHGKQNPKFLQLARKQEQNRNLKYPVQHKHHLPDIKPSDVTLMGLFFLALLVTASAVSLSNTCEVEQKLADSERIKVDPENELYLHIKPFLDKDGYFSPSTISKELEALHAPLAGPKGLGIFAFNRLHAGSSGPITKNTDFSPHIHLGTARIWNRNGKLNETNWQKLVKFTQDTQSPRHQDIILESTWENFIKKINAEEGPEPGTGRDASTLLSSKKAQEIAGSAARVQVFDLFSKGKTAVKNEGKAVTQERYMTLSDLELFYRDTGKLLSENRPKR